MSLSALAAKVRTAYNACRSPTEHRNPDGTFTVDAESYLALLELRNMALDVETALLKADEFVAIERGK